MVFLKCSLPGNPMLDVGKGVVQVSKKRLILEKPKGMKVFLDGDPFSGIAEA